MIESLLILFTSFMSGALGIINLIGTGFIFQMINLISKLSNGPDILWRIHLGNFIISALFMIFNFKYMIGRIFFSLSFNYCSFSDMAYWENDFKSISYSKL